MDMCLSRNGLIQFEIKEHRLESRHDLSCLSAVILAITVLSVTVFLNFRIHVGAGYRVYFGEVDNTIVLLLCGGDKASQTRDIARAKTYLREEHKETQLMREMRNWREYLIERLAADREETVGFLQAVMEDYQVYGNSAAVVSAVQVVVESQGGVAEVAQTSGSVSRNAVENLVKREGTEN